MVEPRPITAFLARLRVGSDFGAMIQLRDGARIVGRTNIIHSFSMIVKAVPYVGNMLVFIEPLVNFFPGGAGFRNSLYAVQ
jgi:hypothetical protein